MATSSTPLYQGLGWPIHLCLVLMAVSIAAAIGHQALGLRLNLAMAAFLMSFGSLKVLLATRQINARRRTADGSLQPAPHFTSVAIFWIWVGMKFAVGTLEWAAALYLLTRPTAFIGW